MPLQVPQWTDFLVCPVCENNFELKTRLPISLGCGHSVCKTCLSNLQRSVCPFDQAKMTISLDKLPVNTALALLIDPHVSRQTLLSKFKSDLVTKNYDSCMVSLEKLALYLKPSTNATLSRPLQRKLVNLINCQILEEDGRIRAIRQAKSLCERSVTELILQHQNPQQLSTNLWAAVRTRGCQFLGPAMQEEVLKLVLLALEDGSALSRKVLVMFVVQRLEPLFPQASKTSIGHVVQLLYRASCFIVMKRDGDSSLMQLKDEFRSYETLRREHDAQIVQIAMEAGLRIAPDQWSSLLYGDTNHKSHMQSIIDKLQTPQSFSQSIQELVIALQRTGDPGKLTSIRHDLDQLSSVDVSAETSKDWGTLEVSLNSCLKVLNGLVSFVSNHSSKRNNPDLQNSVGSHTVRYQQKQSRNSQIETCSSPRPVTDTSPLSFTESQHQTPVAQVAPVPREFVPNPHRTMLHPVLHHSPSPLQLPPSIDSYHHQIPFLHHVMQGPMADIVHHAYSGLMPTTRPAQQQQQLHPHQAMHLRLQQYIPTETAMVIENQGSLQMMSDSLTEIHRQSAVAQAKKMCSLATRSLSALKSRREEIIDNLEDLVGKDETIKISNLTTERANTLQNLQNVTDDRGQYSMWNPQYLAPPMSPLAPVQPDQENVRIDDEIIPFADTPQISRFGPISRRNICPQSVPTQSQAIIGDDTMPTTVVRHSKHMSRPMAAPAALINQNGTRTTLQPVAVGANGEIGYIAIQEPPIAVGAAAAAADMQHIHQSSLISPLQRHPTAYTHHHSGDSERVKQLQFQLSSLNLTHISNPSENLYRDPVIGEREQLTSELQMIENTIQDREREIKVNQLRNVSKEVDDSSTASQGQMLEGYSSITTTAKLGQASSSGRNVVLDIS